MINSKDPELIKKTFKRLQSEAQNIITSIIELVYFMRGSIQYHDMLLMTYAERELVREFIEKRLDAEKGSMSPVY